MKGSGNLTVDKMEGNFNQEDTQVSIGKKDNKIGGNIDLDLNSIGRRKQSRVGEKRKMMDNQMRIENPMKRGRRGDEIEEENLDNIDIKSLSEDDISDCYLDLVKVACQICGENFELDLFDLHLEQHGIDIDDYIRANTSLNLMKGVPVLREGKENRPSMSFLEPHSTSLKYHRCHICNQVLLFTKTRLKEHLLKHKVLLADYEQKFFAKTDLKTEHKVPPEKHEQTSLSSTKRKMVKPSDLSDDLDAIFSNDYEDECLTVCSFCNRSC